MNPAILQALLSFAPGLISSLFGNPAKKYQQQVRNLTNPANVSKLTQQFYQQAQGSPAFSQAQGAIGAGANATSAQIAQKLGESGISGSGTGAILSSITPSIVGQQMGQLRTNAYQGAQGQAQQSIQQQLAALTGSTINPQTGQTTTSPTQQYLGAGLDALGPYIQDLIKKLSKQTLSGGGAPAAYDFMKN